MVFFKRKILVVHVLILWKVQVHNLYIEQTWNTHFAFNFFKVRFALGYLSDLKDIVGKYFYN